jgi:hypothetical protein
MVRYFPLSLLIVSGACGPRGEPAPDPGNPAPVTMPAPGSGSSPQSERPIGGTSPTRRGSFPGRASEAPLVRVEEVLTTDSLLGRRVRISGRCTAAGAGRRAGSWTLEDSGASIEVRGLVPSACAAGSKPEITIFAQIEPASSTSRERLLLRLPD